MHLSFGRVCFCVTAIFLKPIYDVSMRLHLFFTLLTLSAAASAHPELDRLRGFAEHQEEVRRYDLSREKGEVAYYEELEKWERERIAAAQEYQKRKVSQSPKEGGPEWLKDREEKKAFEMELEKARKAHVAAKDSFDRRNYKNLPSESEELGLISERPRYDYRRRASFGATPRFGSEASGGGSSSRGSFGGSSGGGSSFPPPPRFDDFGDGDTGFVPAPNLGEYDSGGDFPPPPPPPPPPPFSDTGEFPDLPPPPPADFGEGMPADF